MKKSKASHPKARKSKPGPNRFQRIAKGAARATGNAAAFGLAAGAIVIWAVLGPVFGFSDTWQLVINTATTIITFLMVFLIQNTQNRDSEAVQLKLDELIRATRTAHNALLDIEELSEAELDEIKCKYEQLARKAIEDVRAGHSDLGTPDVGPEGAQYKMKILVLNPGSSSLKLRLMEVEDGENENPTERWLAQGKVQLGSNGRLELKTPVGTLVDKRQEIVSFAHATRLLLDRLDDGDQSCDAVGIRIVHGGPQFSSPTLVNDELMDALGQCAQLAPMHNQPALDVIREASRHFPETMPTVATFDTAFHQCMPARAREYAIPLELANKHGLHRYGFHGFAHRSMMEGAARLARQPVESLKLVTLQLGSECSATAIDHGGSVETSMGLTPLEGLMMSTRSGDADPALAAVLERFEGLSPDEVDECLNTRSGLLGVSGISGDVQVLMEAERLNPRAALAMEMFCHRIRKYVGAYLTVLEGADAIVFGGGIGENEPAIRKRICEGLGWCGLTLDDLRNDSTVGGNACISVPNSKIAVHVVSVAEEVLIARDTFHLVASRRPAVEIEHAAA